MLKDLTAECWNIGNLKRKVQGDNIAGFDFFRSNLNASWGKEVNSSNLESELAMIRILINVQDSHNHPSPKPKRFNV